MNNKGKLKVWQATALCKFCCLTILGVKKSMILHHFGWFGQGCDMGQGGWISGASQWLCDIGWLKISAEFNIQPGPFYSSKKSILRGWKNYDFLVWPPVGVTGDKCSTSATSTQPVTCDGQTIWNGTVYQTLDYHRNHGITYNPMAFSYFSHGVKYSDQTLISY